MAGVAINLCLGLLSSSFSVGSVTNTDDESKLIERFV